MLKNSFLLLCLIFGSFSVLSQEFTCVDLENFPGLNRDDAEAFAIDNIVYVGTGNHSGFAQSNRFYAYNTVTQSWSEIAAFPGSARQYSRAEVIGKKGYIIGGIDLFGNPLSDIWEYNPELNKWTELTSFPGGERWQAASFVLQDKLYYGTGRDWDRRFNDLWMFDPKINKWEKKQSIPDLPLYETVSFAIFDRGYIGLGRDCTTVFLDVFWSYDPDTDSWANETSFPGGARYYAKGESYNGFGFVFTGEDHTNQMKKDVWIFDPFNHSWTRIPDLNGPERRGVSSCAVPFQGIYISCGLSGDYERMNSFQRIEYNAGDSEENTIEVSSNGTLLNIRNLKAGEELMIYAVTGQNVYRHTNSTGDLNIFTGSWPNGAYILQTGRFTEKFIVFH